MAWHVYAVSPIDHDWELLPLAESVAADIAREQAVEVVHRRPGAEGAAYHHDVAEFLAALQEAKTAARNAKWQWEGDYRPDKSPRVFWLPDPGWSCFRYGFVWKQDNNGMTFVVSPFPLPWLE